MKKLILLALVIFVTSCSEYRPSGYAELESYVVSKRDSSYDAASYIWSYRLWLQKPTETFCINTDPGTYYSCHKGDTLTLLIRYVEEK